jgi:NAD+ synthetase
LVQDLVDYRVQARISTAVLGMSGGVDSALTAALLKRAGWRVIGFMLPIEQDPVETERGTEACEALGLEHFQLDLSDLFHGAVQRVSKLDPGLSSSDEDSFRIRRGNMRARLRMLTLYDQAHRFGGLVASTDNFSELGAGFWTLHGDVGDLAPIQSLLKSWEVPWLAQAYGVPERTWRATPTDGLGISTGDEAQIGASYLEWDLMIFAVAEALSHSPGMKVEDLPTALGTSSDERPELVLKRALRRLASTWHKRASPIRPSHPASDRFGTLNKIDAQLFMPEVLQRRETLRARTGERREG